MNNVFGEFEKAAAAYYTEKLQRHGTTPAGVDWNSQESQHLRFEQLLKIIGPEPKFSILDYGCGYGALRTHLAALGRAFDYIGYDVAHDMVTQAERIHESSTGTRWTTDIATVEPAGYAVASGVFNVKLDAGNEEWTSYVISVLDRLHTLSSHGFAFNMLTKYSDPEKMRPNLYYGDPCLLFDHCKLNYSRHVALLHDYGLWEFTVLVRK